MYPGWWEGGYPEGCYTGYPSRTIPGPIFSIFKARGPTYGQMKLILEVSMRFPRKGSRIDSELTRIDPRIDPESTSRYPPEMVPR